MQRHAFGNTDLKVSELGLGCARIGGVFQGDTPSFMRLLAIARDAGITFFDTADMYSQGESEALLGRAFRKRRSDVIITTKAGYCLPGRRKLAGRLKPLLRPVIRALGIRRDRLPRGVRGELKQDFTPQYLQQAVERSLRRLQTDYVDLFQLHSPPVEVIERGEWEPALESLKRSGKIRYYGISCDSLEAAFAALRFENVSSLQFTFNLLETSALEELLPAARARNVGVIARECLGNGLLVKPAEAIRLEAYCSSPEQQEQRASQLAALRARAASEGASLANLALRYVTGTEGVSVALVGARTPQQLRDVLDQASG